MKKSWTKSDIENLTASEKVGLLYAAHALLAKLLDTYFSYNFIFWSEITGEVHLQLRTLVEDLILTDDLDVVRDSYVCPIQSLFRDKELYRGDWEYNGSIEIDRFHSAVAELFVQTGYPDPPDTEPFRGVLKYCKGRVDRYKQIKWAGMQRIMELDKHDDWTHTKALNELMGGTGQCRKITPPDMEESDMAAFGDYLCSDRIHLSGITDGQSNIVLVNSRAVKVVDSLFTLLLRFVVESKSGKDGWVSTHDLDKEGVIADAQRHQPYSRLRKVLENDLLERDGKKFIENRPKEYLISDTHFSRPCCLISECYREVAAFSCLVTSGFL